MYFDLPNNSPSDTIEVSVDDGQTWDALAYDTGTRWRVMVVGPDAEDKTGALLVAEQVCPLVRFQDMPEIPVRTGDTIFVV